jgi:hypothetical protein
LGTAHEDAGLRAGLAYLAGQLPDQADIPDVAAESVDVGRNGEDLAYYLIGRGSYSA